MMYLSTSCHYLKRESLSEQIYQKLGSDYYLTHE